MKEKILAWVAEQKTPIEQCIVAAAQDFFKKNNPAAAFSTVLYDLKQSQKESLALGRGTDLCYDRFTTGVLYSLFYQGRRINTSLTFAIDFVMEAIEKKQPITVFDLGAGAGAVQIALGLCLQGARELNTPLPKVRIINIDISPFMLEYAQRYLLPAFRAAFPEGFNHLLAEYEAVSWTNHGDLKVTNPFIVASYLFDHSDNQEEVTSTFSEIIRNSRETSTEIKNTTYGNSSAPLSSPGLCFPCKPTDRSLKTCMNRSSVRITWSNGTR
jgi:DNA helicase-2/ATP-dependent DNA helicase PcrA